MNTLKNQIFYNTGNSHGIILVYDVTRFETFENLRNWLKECDLYSTFEDCVCKNSVLIRLFCINECTILQQIGKIINWK